MVVPQLANVDFVASGRLTGPLAGPVVFDVATRGPLLRQVMVIENTRLDLIYDRATGTLGIVDHEAVELRRAAGAAVGLFTPFASIEAMADAPLDIVRDGIDRHLGHDCERYRATGTAGGKPIAVFACLTVEGIPLVAEVIEAGPGLRAELTALRVGSAALEHFDMEGYRAGIDLMR